MYFENIIKELKDLDVMFFMAYDCPHCIKVKSVMEKENTLRYVKQIDINTENGNKLALDYGVLDKGIPNFISKTLKSGLLGYKESTKQIIDELKSAHQNGSVKDQDQDPSQYQIVLFIVKK